MNISYGGGGAETNATECSFTSFTEDDAEVGSGILESTLQFLQMTASILNA